LIVIALDPPDGEERDLGEGMSPGRTDGGSVLEAPPRYPGDADHGELHHRSDSPAEYPSRQLFVIHAEQEGESMTEAQDKRQRVLVLYGGDAATNPRHELLAWLRGNAMNIDAQVVAEDAPHSEGAVDDRVDARIEWAEKAIALVTPDARCQHGAPNVMDEIGRWRGKKGKRSLCIVRQDGVTPYSNHAGIVYVAFKERVMEASEKLRMFLADAPGSPSTGRPLHFFGTSPRDALAPLLEAVRTTELWNRSLATPVFERVAALDRTHRAELVVALGATLQSEPDENVRWHAATVVEFLVQWMPPEVPDELLALMTRDSFFSVRSAAAVSYCHLARMAPARVPLDCVTRLMSPAEDWYVMTPATTAMIYLARTRTIVLEVLASMIGADGLTDDHLASVFAAISDEAPASLRDDVADLMLKSRSAALHAVGVSWLQLIEQRRQAKQPLDHFVF
jgi:hypothetical protein